MTNETHTPALLYVADAMCSWCWGFAPVAEELRRRYRDRLPVELIMGGLRPGPAAVPVDEAMRNYLRHAWQAVRGKSGQRFNHEFFNREAFTYDTEPAAKAVVAVREWQGEARAFDFFHALQEAFYTRNVDITEPSNYEPLLAALEVEPASFYDRYRSKETEEATHRDYAEARRMGVNGFPSLVLRRDGLAMIVTCGYVPLEPALRAIEEALEQLAG